METKTIEKIKTWTIVGLFILCFFGFMIFSYRYKNLSEKYEEVVKETVDHRKLIDSLLMVNSCNEDIIDNLNNEIQALNVTISDLITEKSRLTRELKNSRIVISNNMSVATEILRVNLENEML